MNHVNIEQTEILSDSWYTLKKISYSFENKNGEKETQVREVYDRGDGATILLYNTDQNSVILTRQFRLPTFINGNESGFMIEACAGLLEDEDPEHCVRRETEEETGYRIDKLEKVFEAYMSPGCLTEIIHFFIAEYTPFMKTGKGGGLEDEQEDIEILELSIDAAMGMLKDGRIKDAKTIMLLQYLKIHHL
jgi:GDP-mannose pyrophosphatase NudK